MLGNYMPSYECNAKLVLYFWQTVRHVHVRYCTESAKSTDYDIKCTEVLVDRWHETHRLKQHNTYSSGSGSVVLTSSGSSNWGCITRHVVSSGWGCSTRVPLVLKPSKLWENTMSKAEERRFICHYLGARKYNNKG